MPILSIKIESRPPHSTFGLLGTFVRNGVLLSLIPAFLTPALRLTRCFWWQKGVWVSKYYKWKCCEIFKNRLYRPLHSVFDSPLDVVPVHRWQL